MFSSSALAIRAACFVTLRRREDGELRGCCGETEARRPLLESVAEMAVAAAEWDPRFPPVEPEELNQIDIGISVLGPLRPIDPRAVEAGRHGLRIVARNGRGLLLPHVALELGWDREQLLRGVCEKAGLEPEAWKRGAGIVLEAFEALSWSEASQLS